MNTDQNPPDILYYYCPTEAFYNIIQFKSIWLYLLTLSNDSTEGRILKDFIEKKAKDSRMKKANQRGVEAALKLQLEFKLAFGFCLTKESDSLPQWRMYAGNADGIAIGFNSSYFKKLIDGTRMTLNKVEYLDPKERSELLEDIWNSLRNSLNCSDSEPSSPKRSESHQAAFAALDTGFHVDGKFFGFKHVSFKQEAEWRLVRYELGYKDAKNEIGVKHSCRGGQIKPYLKVKLVPDDNPVTSECLDPKLGTFTWKDKSEGPIRSVTLGPNHRTPIAVIERFLDANGFAKVEVKESSIPYQ